MRQIKIGDIVDIVYNDGCIKNVEIIHMPQFPGDLWQCKDAENIFAINTMASGFECIRKPRK